MFMKYCFGLSFQTFLTQYNLQKRIMHTKKKTKYVLYEHKLNGHCKILIKLQTMATVEPWN